VPSRDGTAQTILREGFFGSTSLIRSSHRLEISELNSRIGAMLSD
jgi:hypothetical protein